MPEHRYGLSAGRWLVAHAAIVAVIGLQLLDVAKPAERWPFAPYAMYASVQGPEFGWHVVYGVSGAREFALNEERYYPPLDTPRLAYAFGPQASDAELILPPTHDMLRVVGRLYERARLSGVHDGPVLTGLRLYKVSWALEPTLSNRGQPTGRELVDEIVLGE